MFDILPNVFNNIFTNYRQLNKLEIMKTKYVDMIFLQGYDMYDKDLYSVKSYYKSLVNAPTLVNKFFLHKEFINSDFFPETILIDKNKAPPKLSVISKKYKDNIWIWRTDNKSGGGKDIAIITSQKEIDDIYEKFITTKHKLSLGGSNALITKYISNPDLWLNPHNGKKYKYHLRIYYLVIVSREKNIGRRACVFKNNHIVLGANPYINKDHSNTSIHDTHFKNGMALFPEDYKDKDNTNKANDILNKICNILKIISTKELPKIQVYEEAEINFKLYGCDFMVDNNSKVFLLEINNMPCFKFDNVVNLYKGIGTNVTQYNIHHLILKNIYDYLINYNSQYNSDIKNQIENSKLQVVEVYNSNH